MSIYNDNWDLSTIPDKILRSEWGRRSAGKRKSKKGGYRVSCSCGLCRTCKLREYQRLSRERRKKNHADR